MRTGADQLSPRSAERRAKTEADRPVPSAAKSMRSPTFTSAPGAGTTITLPIVWLAVPGSKMARAGSQVAPPSAVRANIAGPPPVLSRRSQAAYA